MFDAIGNLPLHPLVLHAAVVGIPLALLLAVLFAVPRTRSWARRPLAVTAVGALVATILSRASGEGLQAALGIVPGDPVGDLIARHAELATQLLVIMVVFTVLALANVFVVPRPTDDAEARTRTRTRTRQGALAVVLPVLLVLVGAVAGFWVYRVGDIGSRAVWNPTGTQDYSVSGSG